jgi:uncharacterized membrane protein
VTAARLRQWRADLLAAFWLRPTLMTVAAVILAELLVRAEGAFELPSWIEGWVYAGGTAGARDVLGAIGSAMIGVAGTTFSITVAALTLASNQMGPRLLRNFTRDPGNQYALGALVATFAYALVALRSVHEAEEGAFVPQLAVSVGLLLAFGCVGVLIWFLHHVASSISVDRVIALVQRDLSQALARLPSDPGEAGAPDLPPCVLGASLCAPGGGYLRVLDDNALADWAGERDARLQLLVRPGDFVFPGSEIGMVWPATEREEAQAALGRALSLGDGRNLEQDLEFAVRQLVEIGLRALSPGINDPFTAIVVMDRLGAALCELVGRDLPTGHTSRDGRLRLSRPTTDYAGLLDAMFHMLRQAGADQPAVMIRLLEVLGEIGAVEQDPDRRRSLWRHAGLAHDAAMAGTQDAAARETIAARYRRALDRMAGESLTRPS